jgi:hypothetical protein
MLCVEDEAPHAPPGVPGWQENCFLMGWDPGAGLGFYLHVERLPEADHQEVKAMVVSEAEVVAARTEVALDATFAGVEVVAPFRALQLSFSGTGRRRGGRTAFIDEGPGHVAVAFDIELEATSAPVDWGVLLSRMAVEGTERNHYEQGLRWKGRLHADGRTIDAEGLAVRDHTWGARQYDGFDYAWWTPTALDDGTFVTGVSLKLGEAWVGGSFAADGEDVQMFLAHQVDVEGPAGPASYDRATVQAGDGTLDAVVRTHIPVRYPGFGLPFVSSEGFATVTDDRGRTGFGTVEINGPF